MQKLHKFELFKPYSLKHSENVVSTPLKMYPQERDWTCSIACIRTILSSVINDVSTENVYITAYDLKPQPYYSKDIKKLSILDEYDSLFGCDYADMNFDGILDLCEQNYYIMLECMINYAHWLVFLGYYPSIDGNVENSNILLFDPYYNKIRLVNTDEFISMWIDGNYANSKVKADFIAIKSKT